MPDLHAGFSDPQRVDVSALVDFLKRVDSYSPVQAIHEAMRRMLELRPGMRILDAGCGIGLEAARLARIHPEVEFVGLDQNDELLAIARRVQLPNLSWVHGGLESADLPEAGFDVIRTARVLMYLRDPLFGQVLDRFVRLLRPGGRLVTFELDYGAIILPKGRHDDHVVHGLTARMERAMPQPWCGRRLPDELVTRGMTDVTADPFAVSVDAPVWIRIVHDTLREALRQEANEPPELVAWLDDYFARVDEAPLLAVITGILTAARVPRSR
ncbi:methyltransferase domain-containing protein [Rhodoligotrophos ferricapiens]|uniref:methyltransferase domain-containing protein n=1 Tax=Rhodoligotrophos ferricapiens TaxID=3069264 RepID=UPI00315D0F5E